MRGGDLYVSNSHMGVVAGRDRGIAAMSTARGTGVQGIGGQYAIRRFTGKNAAKAAGTGPWSYGAGGVPRRLRGGISNLLVIARWLAGRAGWSANGAAGAAGNIYQESLGNPLSVGTGGRGLIGWTPPTRLPNYAFVPGNASLSMRRQLPLASRFFRQNMGRYWYVAQRSNPARAALVIMNMGERPAGSSQSNPFYRGSGTSRGYLRARMASQVRRRMARGGILREPVEGIGVRSGARYSLGENAPRGPEAVSPLRGPAPDVGGQARSIEINVYPRANQDERAIAAAVSRELAWAEAGGRR
jgi:hypothetical protein